MGFRGMPEILGVAGIVGSNGARSRNVQNFRLSLGSSRLTVSAPGAGRAYRIFRVYASLSAVMRAAALAGGSGVSVRLAIDTTAEIVTQYDLMLGGGNDETVSDAIAGVLLDLPQGLRLPENEAIGVTLAALQESPGNAPQTFRALGDANLIYQDEEV